MLEPPDETLRRQAKRNTRCASRWNDTVWKWDESPPGTGEHGKRIQWDFRMADGSRFNEPQWAEWTEAMKIAVWSLIADPIPERRTPRMGTVRFS